MKKPKKERSPDWQRRRLKFIIWTIVILLVVTGITIGVCAWYWMWTWDMILEEINPVWNPKALAVYILIVMALFVLVWLLHRYHDEKEER